MMFVRKHRSSPRRAFTLVELLVVCAIFVLVAAIAIPTVRPALANGKVREASRQFNAFIAEAKAHAAARGRPVGLMIDRDSAAREGGRQAYLPFRMFLAEVPPPYAGDVTDATVTIGTILDAATTGNVLQTRLVPAETLPSIQVLDNANNYTPQYAQLRQLTFDNTKVTMLRTIMASYLPSDNSTNHVPFSIRFNNSPPDYPGYLLNTGATSPPVAFIVCNYGSHLHGLTFNGTKFSQPVPFAISFPPQRSTDSPLELPAGMVLDLQYSGYGRSGVEFNGSNTQPLILMFSPGGTLTLLHDGSRWTAPASRLHFLIGSLKNAIESNPNNLGDAKSIWVSIQSQTGHVITSDNNPSSDVAVARDLAIKLDTKGGR